MVAGIIAAQSGNGLGIDGVNPHARIMALRALDSRGVGHAFAIAEAIVYAASNGAQVINLSLGGPVMTAVERQAIDYAEALGAVVVAAAGNEAQELLDYGPALAPAALVVGALDRTNQRLASANWGQRIDLVAPGEDILSLRAPATDMMRKFDPALAGQHIAGDDNAYYRASGTSFAAPFVSGVASLLLARSPTLKPAEVRRIIRNAARDIGVPGIDQQTGRGTLDGPAALSADPAFFIDAEIAAVSAGRNNGSLVLSVTGTADSHQFARAELSMSRDPDSGHWRDLAVLRKPVVDGELASVPASAFKGESQWTLRLLVAHRGGRHAESRFLVNLE
jgi:subtilisin family serine protease